MRIILPYQVIIDQNIKHALQFENDGQLFYKHYPSNSFEFESGVKICFDGGPIILTRVIFQKLGA